MRYPLIRTYIARSSLYIIDIIITHTLSLKHTVRLNNQKKLCISNIHPTNNKQKSTPSRIFPSIHRMPRHNSLTPQAAVGHILKWSLEINSDFPSPLKMLSYYFFFFFVNRFWPVCSLASSLAIYQTGRRVYRLGQYSSYSCHRSKTGRRK